MMAVNPELKPESHHPLTPVVFVVVGFAHTGVSAWARVGEMQVTIKGDNTVLLPECQS